MPSEDEFCGSLYGELQSESACSWYVTTSHRELERGIGPLPLTARILELGGNLGEHCPFVEHPYAEYVVTDYRPVEFTPINERIHFEVADAQQLPYADGEFDRVIVTCVLHHLRDPEAALLEMRRVTAPGGIISVLIPCDPGMAYRAGKRIGPYRFLRRRKAAFDPRVFHYRQHRNHFPGLETLLDHVFKEDTIRRRYWPWRIPLWNANLFVSYQIVVKG